METKRVQITGRLKVGPVTYEQGDVRSLPVDEADYLINMGWAKCSVTGRTGERNTEPVKLDVHNARLPVGAK